MNIAFLGLGAMGRLMAARLIEQGHKLRVYNRSPEAAEPLIAQGAKSFRTPHEAADGASLVLSIVTDDAAARELWMADGGALRGLGPGAIAIESSTVTPTWVRELSCAVHAAGADFLDAPVAGSTPQAQAGALAFLLGGQADVIEKARPALEAMGKVLLHVGPTSHGSIFKLLVNALFATQVATLGELLGAAAQQGLDVARVVAMLSKMPVSSPAAIGVAQLMVDEDYAPRFPARLVAKDLRYAATLGATMPTVAAAEARFSEAVKRGDGDANLSVVTRLSRSEATHR